MNPSATLTPFSAHEVFDVESDEHIRVRVKPIHFYLPERAAQSTPSLHIVIDGWINFDGSVDEIRTIEFGTRVAYTRAKAASFEHVYGTHYDQAEDDLGHPVFHAQIRSMVSLTSAVPGCKPEAVTDLVSPILSNVRTPTAQMDVFSAIEQVCADHLLWEKSEPSVREAYSDLRQHCSFFTGSAHLLRRFRPEMAECGRSTHWYESP